jgi:hypothetical protein
MDESDSEYWLFINVKNQMRSRKISQAKADLLIRKLSKEDVGDWYAWTLMFRDWLPLKNLVLEKDGSFQLMIQFKDNGPDTRSDNTKDIAESTMITDRESTHIPEKYLEIGALIEEKPLDEGDFVGDQLTLSNIPNPPSLSGLFEKEFAEGNILRSSNRRKGGRVKQEFETNSDRRGATRYDIKLEVLVLGKGTSFRTETLNLSQTGALLLKALPDSLAEVRLEVVFIFKKGNVHEKLAVKGKVLSTRENLRYLTFSNISSEEKKAFERLIKIYFQEISR